MAIVTLTTDLGTSDFYVGAIKGNLISQIPQVNIVDISHNIKHFDTAHAAFVIKNCFEQFPVGSIHILGVRPEITPEIDHVAILYKGHYFIGADNGQFSLIFDQQPEKIISLNVNVTDQSLAFPTRGVFVYAAAHISRGGPIELLGRAKDFVRVNMNVQPILTDSMIRGSILHVDSFGNLITNVHKTQFIQLQNNRDFELTFRGIIGNGIKKINQSYFEQPEGELVALFGSTGYLEIGIHFGNANHLLGLKKNDTISINFYDH